MAEGKNSRRGNRQSGHQRERRSSRDNRRARDSGRERARRPRRRHRRAHTERGYLSRVLSSLIVVVMVLSALIMFFRVKIVNITGAHRYSDAEILSIAGVSDGQNMFLMNKYRMAEKLIRELTYLEDVHISRNFPDTLIIDLKECVLPLAVAQDGACWLVSPSGKIVDRLDISAADDYAQITGCPILSPSIGTQIALPSEYLSQQRSLVRLLTALDEKQVLDDVDGIRLDKHNCILVDYGGRFTVKFPLDADYHFKLHALEVYISGEKIQDNMTGTFDLTRDDKNYFQPNIR